MQTRHCAGCCRGVNPSVPEGGGGWRLLGSGSLWGRQARKEATTAQTSLGESFASLPLW